MTVQEDRLDRYDTEVLAKGVALQRKIVCTCIFFFLRQEDKNRQIIRTD